MKLTIPVPKQMSHLPIDDRGYPIPFFAPRVKGKPEFKFADKDKVLLCVNHKLCHVCGKKLFKDSYYFVTGPTGLKNGVVSAAPMHKECAEFSLSTCPHLHFEKSERKIETKGTFAIDEKPDIIYLVRAGKFKILEVPEKGTFVIRFSAVISKRKFVYKDNLLTEAHDFMVE